MSERIYTVAAGPTAVTTAVDLLELTPADDKPVELVGLFVSQTTEVGDAQDEMIGYSIIRGNATSGSGGSAPTARPLNRSDTPAGFTAEVFNTTAASAGTPLTLFTDAFNVRAGLQLWIPEGCEPQASQTDTTLVVRLLGAPADSISFTLTAFVREIG